MKDIIKKASLSGFVFGVTLLFTVFAGTWVYAASVGTVTTGDSLTASMWNAMEGEYTYSTTEVDTGKTWINGKPIYRKVIEAGDLSAEADGTAHTILLNLDSFEYMVDSIVSLSGRTDFKFYSSLGDQFRYYTNQSGNIILVASSNYSSYLTDVVIIAEYTKTTD